MNLLSRIRAIRLRIDREELPEQPLGEQFDCWADLVGVQSNLVGIADTVLMGGRVDHIYLDDALSTLNSIDHTCYPIWSRILSELGAALRSV